MKHKLPTRQVHLDFHTSEHIPDIGIDFDEKEFILCLQKARVNSITLFAMGHHGWCYYDSKVAEPHPNLKTNLLPRMLKACKDADIATPIYITVQWNAKVAREHPDWIRCFKGGKKESPVYTNENDIRPFCSWDRICLNTPYVDEILKLTDEVMERFNPVGIFYDITGEYECYCEYCKSSMKEKGIDIENPEAVKLFGKSVYKNYMQRTSELIWKHKPKCRLYHNGSDKKGRDDLFPYYSHYEIESLPSGMWGYDHFPTNAKYFFPKGLPYLGMTGKFHGMWGEFGGFKNPNALVYECNQILSLGGACCIGDQLHPSGKIDEETYRTIGEAYKNVEKKEKWCINVKPVAEIAILSPSAVLKHNEASLSDMGATVVLMEAKYLFDMIDDLADFSKYRLIILPDEVLISDKLKIKLENYSKYGGKLLLSGVSGLDINKTEFQIDTGLKYEGKSEWNFDYTQVEEALSENMVTSAYVNVDSAIKTTLKGATVLAKILKPYFNRTYKTYCSHQNTPPETDATYPSVAQNKNIIYIAHKIFKMYKENGMQLYRDLVINCIKRLLPEPMLTVKGLPSAGRINLTKNKETSDYVLHTLYVSPIKRGDAQVIEDIIPIYNIEISLKLDENIKEAILVPSMEKIELTNNNNIYSFKIPKLDGHQMILLKT